MKHDVVVQPAEEPLTLKEVKLYLRVTHDTEDNLLATEIVAARRLCENSVRMSFLKQVRRSTYCIPQVNLDVDFRLNRDLYDPDGINRRIYLARGPVQTVESIKTYRNPNAMTTLDSTQYFFNPVTQTIEWEETDPFDVFGGDEFVEVNYTAGLASATAFRAAYPDIVEAIRITIAAMYDEKGFSRQTVPPLAAHLLAMYWSSPTYNAV